MRRWTSRRCASPARPPAGRGSRVAGAPRSRPARRHRSPAPPEPLYGRVPVVDGGNLARVLTIGARGPGRRSWRTPAATIRTRPAAWSPGRSASDRPERVVPMINAARSMTQYEFEPAEQLRVYRELDDRDEEVVVVYHSHTATEAYPSRTDVRFASQPEAHYVLVSTRDPDDGGVPLVTGSSTRPSPRKRSRGRPATDREAARARRGSTVDMARRHRRPTQEQSHGDRGPHPDDPPAVHGRRRRRSRPAAARWAR